MATLSPEYHVIKEDNPFNVTQADLVVGFLSKNDATTIERMAIKVSEGLIQDFPGLKTVLVLSDCHSEDNVVETFFQSPTESPKLAMVTPPDRALETQGLFNLFFLAERLQAKTIVVQNADTLTIKRTWLKRLIQPILDDIADFTNPLYSRNAIDSPVTNLMVYPMIRSLFGRRLRQPILTDWAFNERFLKTLLAYPDWPTCPGLMTPELLVKVLAITGGFRICQSIMTEGRHGLSNLSMDTPHIIKMFQQLARGIFEAMARFKANWVKVTRSKPTSVIGTNLKQGLFPARYQFNFKELHTEILDLLKDTESQWRDVLGVANDLRQYLLTTPLNDLDISAQKWGMFLFQCGGLYENLDSSGQDKLVAAITPVFLARFLTFQKNTLGLSATQVESQVEIAAVNLEKLKKEFLSQLSV
ncbi:MAG: hypothetical protein LBT86_04745 [Deltaproteobacteria bacterium]|jgi:hypothetical protein|nr:hypothetical protein [Deltaproteobacteria bacterium]